MENSTAGPEKTELTRLFGPNTNFDSLPWKPLRAGVDIMVIYGHVNGGPCTALLRYQPGAHVPQHTHSGHEHILVLQGEQADEDGTAVAGTLFIKPPGSSHEIISRTGCIVLAIWENTVIFE